MGFQQGLSGLNAASKSLDAIGNNVANANTVGFKQSEVQFADIFANSFSGAGGLQVGIGTQVTAVVQQFSQGNISASNNPLDIAINGNGFFIMNNNGATTYTRNGQFQLDKNGFIVNAQSMKLTGYQADVNGVLATGALTPININTQDTAPLQTSLVQTTLNLDSRKTVPANGFSITDPTSYNNATSVTVYDSLGNSHIVQTFFVKDPVALTWKVYGASDGAPIGYTPPAAAVPIGTLQFDSSGKMISAVPAFSAASPRSLKLTVPVISGAQTPISTPLSIQLDMSGATQYGSDFSVTAMKQDGYTSGKLSKFTTDKNGTILGSYTNGRSAVLGQVVLASFTNPNGLENLGNNQWTETASSGSR